MLEVKNLSVGYTGRYIIRNVNLLFEPGKCYAVVGKHGCGKSRLLRACAGILQPENGTVFLDGEDLHFLRSDIRAKKIGYMGAQRTTSVKTVEQFMVQSRRPGFRGQKNMTCEDWNRVYNALNSMKACGLMHIPVSQLSDGACQRIRIAGLLAQDSAYLVMDEPTVFLDSESRQIFHRQLLQLKYAKKTVIFATHDIDLALKCSDEMIAIDLGREICQGDTASIVEGGTFQKIFHQ